MFLSLLPTLFFAAHAVRAANDWSTSCLSGQCSYDVQNGTANGTLTLTGHQHALSDITPAAGWTILDCDPNASEQNIRLVCTGNEQDCDHMYQGEPVNTIVRLPENCGHMPFARIASEWVHANQSIPEDVRVTIRRNKRSNTTVRGLALDTNWRAATPSPDKTVTFHIEGTSTPTLPVGNTDGNVTKRWSSGEQGLSVNVDKSFTLLDQTISCPAMDGFPALQEHTSMGVEAKAQAQVGYSMSASGSIFPPGVKDVTMSTTLDATMNGILNIDASASANFDTGRVNIFTFPLAGLDFPHILTLGPSFYVDVQGTAALQAQMNMNVDLAYSISGAKLSFPSSQSSTLGNASPTDSNLQLSTGGNGNLDATLTAHVIPGVKFGLSALSLASADVKLDVDASATLEMTLSESFAVSSSSSKSSVRSTASQMISSTAHPSSSAPVTSSSPKSNTALSSSLVSSATPTTSSRASLTSSISSLFSSATSTSSSHVSLTSSISSISSIFSSVTPTTTTSHADLTSGISSSTISASTVGTTTSASIPTDGSGVAPTDGGSSLIHTPGSGTTFVGIGESSISATTHTSIYSSASTSPVLSYTASSTILRSANSSVRASSSATASRVSSSVVVVSASTSMSALPTYTSAHSTGCNHTAAPTTTTAAPILVTRTVTGVETVTSFETLTTVETFRSVEPETSIEVITLSPAAPTPTPLHFHYRAESSSFDGCVNLSTALNINIGADGSFFGLFDESKSFTLFQRNFKLFERCYRDSVPVPVRRWVRSTGSRHRTIRRHPRDIVKRGNGLTCVPGVSGLLSSVVNELIPSDTISPL